MNNKTGNVKKKRTDRTATTATKYKQMVLVIENPKRFQSSSPQLILKEIVPG